MESLKNTPSAESTNVSRPSWPPSAAGTCRSSTREFSPSTAGAGKRPLSSTSATWGVPLHGRHRRLRVGRGLHLLGDIDPSGRSRYGFLLNEAGGVIDDLIVFRLAEDEAMVVVNAATIDKDFAAIAGRLSAASSATFPPRPASSTFKGRSPARSSQRWLARDHLDPVLQMHQNTDPWCRCIVSRTGYTGELDTKSSCRRKRRWSSGTGFWKTPA